MENHGKLGKNIKDHERSWKKGVCGAAVLCAAAALAVLVLVLPGQHEAEAPGAESYVQNPPPDFITHYQAYSAAQMYDEFLDGVRSAGGWDIMKIQAASAAGGQEAQFAVRYIIADVTGDGLPELHIIYGGTKYLIFTAGEGEMRELAYLQNHTDRYDLLEGGGFLVSSPARSGAGVYYKYFELDGQGEPVYKSFFSWKDSNQNNRYDEQDEYTFDGTFYSYRQWHSMTRKYLYTDTEGMEQARSMTGWNLYSEGRRTDPSFGDGGAFPLTAPVFSAGSDFPFIDEVYLFQSGLDLDAGTGSSVEVHYPQVKRDVSEMDEQVNMLLRDTAFSFFADPELTTYEEVISSIEEGSKDRILDVFIEYDILNYTGSYISILFSVDTYGGKPYSSKYLASIDLNTGQYIHFQDLMDMEELKQILRSHDFKVDTGTTAFFRQEDAYEPDVIEAFIKELETDMDSYVGVDDEYLYIRFYDDEYALDGYFIFKIPLEHTSIDLDAALGRNNAALVQKDASGSHKAESGEKGSLEYTEEEAGELVKERVQSTSFTLREGAIDTDVYDAAMDAEYKNAFWQALLSHEPVQDRKNGEYYFRETSPELDTEDEKAYLECLKNNFDYYYYDFDFDSLPELIVCSRTEHDLYFGGPRVLKYDAEKKQVYNFRSGDWPVWKPYGCGKMYYEDLYSVPGMKRYGFRVLGQNGNVKREVQFAYDHYDPIHYYISVDELEAVEVGWEIWFLLWPEFMRTEPDWGFGCISFDEVFGNVLP